MVPRPRPQPTARPPPGPYRGRGLPRASAAYCGPPRSAAYRGLLRTPGRTATHARVRALAVSLSGCGRVAHAAPSAP
eukprot:6136227-Prymnesium_polylepis.2